MLAYSPEMMNPHMPSNNSTKTIRILKYMTSKSKMNKPKAIKNKIVAKFLINPSVEKEKHK